MPCRCISQIEQKLRGSVQSEGKIDSIYTPNEKIDFKANKTFSVSTVQYVVEGKKEIFELQIAHNYCPFCGEAYEIKLPEKSSMTIEKIGHIKIFKV